MTLNLTEIPGAFHLPRLNWEVIQTWVEEHVAEPDRGQAWEELVVQWLGILNEALGGRYQTERRGDLLLFLPRDYEHSQALLGSAAAGLAVIIDALGSVAGASWLGPLVILLFADADTYCLYVSPFDPERAFVSSAGVCFREGYTHIALRPYALEALQRNMLHEITHACLSHLKLPHWLEEGITQLAEDEATPHWARFTLSTEKANEIRQDWRERGLGDFWWGRGFFSTEEEQEHSYRLAQILFRLIVADHRRQLPEFVRHAHADDAGESAAGEFLGMTLAELATQFLGQGQWEPVPPDCASYCRRGILLLSREQYDKAMADFNEGIRVDPQFADTYTNRGVAHYHLGRYPAAIADYERALELNPRDFHAHNNLAWILATCCEEEHRDGARALEHANQACELSGFTQSFCLASLAAAHAEVGDFEEARTWAKESLRLAPEEERPDCKARLRLYREGKPYREEAKRAVKIKGR